MTDDAAYAAEAQGIMSRVYIKKRKKKVNDMRQPALAFWLSPSYVFWRDRMASRARENCLGVNLSLVEFCGDSDNNIVPPAFSNFID